MKKEIKSLAFKTFLFTTIDLQLIINAQSEFIKCFNSGIYGACKNYPLLLFAILTFTAFIIIMARTELK